MIDAALEWLTGLPALVTYLVLGLGAALENVVPPVPADTFVLVGGFLSARGEVSPWVAFLVTWAANVASAVAVYGAFHHYGEPLTRSRFGRWLLDEKQLEALSGFYQRWGTPAIFFSRFLPAFRALVPAFAGISRVAPARMILPTAIASGLWYGGLVYLGHLAGANWTAVRRAVERINTGLLITATLLAAAIALWWWRTRRK